MSRFYFVLFQLGLADAPGEDMSPEIHGVDQTRFAAHAGSILACSTHARELCNDLLDPLPLRRLASSFSCESASDFPRSMGKPPSVVRQLCWHRRSGAICRGLSLSPLSERDHPDSLGFFFGASCAFPFPSPLRAARAQSQTEKRILSQIWGDWVTLIYFDTTCHDNPRFSMQPSRIPVPHLL